MTALAGKTIVVTGGGQGIGQGITGAMLDAGAAVIVVQRSPLPQELAGHAQVQWIESDLSRADSFDNIAGIIGKTHGSIDALVNNAGVMFEQSLQQMQLDDWNKMLAVNLTAPAFLSRAL